MSEAKGQFNPKSGFENTASGMFENAETYTPDGIQASPRPRKLAADSQFTRLRGYVRKGGIAGLVFAAWASAESLIFTAPVWGTDAALFEIASIAVMVGIPALLMIKRRGFFSSAVVTFLIFMSLIGVITAIANGDPLFTGSAIIVNIVFVALTGRATYAAWKLRKFK